MTRAPLRPEPAGAPSGAAGQPAFDWTLSIPDDLQPEAEQRPANVELNAGMAEDFREILVSFGKKASTAEEVRSQRDALPLRGPALRLTRARRSCARSSTGRRSRRRTWARSAPAAATATSSASCS